LTPTEVDDLDAALESLTGRSRAGARHLMTNPAVAALATDPRLLALARQALGREARPFRATLFDKSPRSNWLVVWHQDTALPLRVRRDVSGWGPWSIKHGVLYAHAPADALRQVVALRVHLDDSTSSNGPLRVLPGTQALGVLADEEIRRLGGRIGAVECTVSRGGVIAMRPLLVHASSKAVSHAPRRVVHIEYATSFSVGPDLELALA
jgi:ectoine hydroxylase-related dioxygenase (phytanoyl-CoA dioxygenase family)